MFLILDFIVLGKEVCYIKYGCFSDEVLFNNFLVFLFQFLLVFGIMYKFFIRVQFVMLQIIDDNDIIKLKVFGYDDVKVIVIFVYGFKGKYILYFEV